MEGSCRAKKQRRPRYHVHEVIGGFLQRGGEITNGMAQLAMKIDRILDPYTNGVQYHSFLMDIKDRARFLELQRQSRGLPRSNFHIHIYAYSYGCDTAVRFARELEQTGLHADTVFLCDPVKRFRWHYAMAWRPLRRLYDVLGLRPVLTVPFSADYVKVFEQDVARPWPSIVRHGEHTVAPVRLQMPHTAMDNSPRFWQEVEDHLERWL